MELSLASHRPPPCIVKWTWVQHPLLYGASCPFLSLIPSLLFISLHTNLTPPGWGVGWAMVPPSACRGARPQCGALRDMALEFILIRGGV